MKSRKSFLKVTEDLSKALSQNRVSEWKRQTKDIVDKRLIIKTIFTWLQLKLANTEGTEQIEYMYKWGDRKKICENGDVVTKL